MVRLTVLLLWDAIFDFPGMDEKMRIMLEELHDSFFKISQENDDYEFYFLGSKLSAE
jgi:hypothetical protein